MKTRIIIIIFLILSYKTALAENSSDNFTFTSLFNNWQVSVGAMPLYIPKYEGSKEMRALVVPIIAPIYRRFLFFTIQGFGVNVPIYKRNIMGSLTLGKDLFRVSGERTLRGLNDEERGWIMTPSVMFMYDDFIGTVTLNKVFSGSDSLFVELKAGYRFKIEDFFTLTLSAKTTWGDKKYMMFKFGITDEQSRVSGFEEFDAGPGFKLVAGSIDMRYKITKEISLILSHTEGLLIGSAAKSPTTFRQRQPRTMMMIMYTFG